MHNLIKLAYIYTKSNNNIDITMQNNHKQGKFFALNLKTHYFIQPSEQFVIIVSNIIEYTITKVIVYFMVKVRRFGLARSRLTAIPCFASMTNRHFAKTLQPQLSHATPRKC